MNVRTFADRVLRLKEEQDALTSDIREIYAEAKEAGFDKTAMGQLVSFLRKREKDPRRVAEAGALFETYLDAYENGTVHATRAHAHEVQPLPSHDPETGELTESDTQHEQTVKPTPLVSVPDGPVSALSSHACGDGAVHGRCEPTAPIISEAEIPDLPRCLDRRERAAA